MNNIFKIIRFTKHLKIWYLFMAVFVISVSLLTLITPYLMKLIVDEIVKVTTGSKDVNLNLIFIYLTIILSTDVIGTILNAYGTWVGDRLSVKLETFLTERFYKHILSLDIGYFDNEITGTIVNKMYRGLVSISDFVKSALNNFLPFFLTAFVTILLLAHYSPFIAILLAALFPAYIIISHRSTIAWNKFEGEKNSIRDYSQGRVFESLNGIRAVKAFTAELTEFKSYSLSRGKIEKLTYDQTKQWHWYDFLRRLVLNGILFTIVSYIVYYTYQSRYTIGEMTFLIQLVNQARWPLFAMSFILGQIQQANAGSKEFFDILEIKSSINDKAHAEKLDIDKKIIKNQTFLEFQNIYFGYDKEQTVLSDVSFLLPAGKKLALVGESGQGKSTLINLILRYYEPQNGKIFIFGNDIQSVTLESLRRSMAVVFQDSLLFSGSIRENIVYGNKDATENEIIKAAKAANAYDFIRKLPDGFDSMIGERGVKLSGGQKQRISIARAILTDAPLIILDEATSSLDSRSEIEVQKGLESLLKDRTSIIIAHRLSTIADADMVLVLSNGKVEQFGPPNELLKNKKGLYARMISLQEKLLTATAEEKAAELKKFDLVG